MFKCLISFWDGSEGRYYEEGHEYEINLEHMAEINVLNRFEGASDAFKPVEKTVKKRVKNEPSI